MGFLYRLDQGHPNFFLANRKSEYGWNHFTKLLCNDFLVLGFRIVAYSSFIF